MHPAFSVIFLTTLIGAGQGLFVALYFGEVFELIPPAAGNVFVSGGLAAWALLTGGLVASFFHLGRPERAWRSAAMWRTSWLSREVIVLPLCMLLMLLYTAAHYFELTMANDSRVSMVVGAIGVMSVMALFICTGMIYACIRFLQEWASPLTVINYTLLGCASGFTLVTGLVAYQVPQSVYPFFTAAIVLTFAALITRSWSLLRNARIKPRATVQSAIGVHHSTITQQAVGFMGGSFNTREFFHGVSEQLFRSVKWVFLILVFPIPLVLLTVGVQTESVEAQFAAFVVQYIGLIAERWFFFAQANHPQNLYYQSVA